jgi:hypothetical protein
MCTAVILFAVLGGSAGSIWQVRAQKAAAPGVPAEVFMERIPPAPVTAGDRGATYHALEATATRVTTTFPDATVVARRAADGKLSATLTDVAGNEMATFRVNRVDAEHDSLEIAITGRTTRHIARRARLRPTLAWSNEQTYSFWKDRDALDWSALEWQETLVRPAGARRRPVSGDAVRMDTEWGGRFSASVTTNVGTHISYLTGRTTSGPVYISSFKDGGNEVGFSQWWPDEQAFAWSFPGLTEGYVDAARLKEVGGWSFTPDMAWMSTQNLAFHQFHTLVNERGSVSRASNGSRWLDAIRRVVSPTVSANEPGCDGLHWLDGSIYRPCCDSHDLCYVKNACTSSSWWMWWSSWQCDKCNISAVFCFSTGGGSRSLTRNP